MPFLQDLDARFRRNLNIWDIGILKVCLFLAGLIVGAYFPEAIRAEMVFVVTVFVIVTAYLLFRFWRKPRVR
ncbi:hypothetical protein BH23VER1_BH23VER1_31640 [soil metagenome]